MKQALQALNRIVDDGVIETYAIGGAIAASFYIEATQTEDIDVFVFLVTKPGQLLSLSPIYEALKAQGGVVEREYVRFGDWPVQILTDANALIAEAIRDAIAVDFDGVSTRIFRAEHLCAVALQLGRIKDYLRVSMFLQQGEVDRAKLDEILARYGLAEKLHVVEQFSERMGAGE